MALKVVSALQRRDKLRGFTLRLFVIYIDVGTVIQECTKQVHGQFLSVEHHLVQRSLSEGVEYVDITMGFQ